MQAHVPQSALNKINGARIKGMNADYRLQLKLLELMPANHQFLHGWPFLKQVFNPARVQTMGDKQTLVSLLSLVILCIRTIFTPTHHTHNCHAI